MGLKLNPQRAKFVAAYLKSSNAAGAAKEAGYSGDIYTLSSTAARIMQDPEVQAAIRAGVKRLEMSADETIQEICRIAGSDIADAFDEQGNLLPIHEIPPDLRKAISDISVEEILVATPEGKRPIARVVKIKLWNKGQALEQLGKRYKLWTERLEVSGEIKVDVQGAREKLAERFKVLEGGAKQTGT